LPTFGCPNDCLNIFSLLEKKFGQSKFLGNRPKILVIRSRWGIDPMIDNNLVIAQIFLGIAQKLWSPISGCFQLPIMVIEFFSITYVDDQIC
jgi:hypothetical protein